MTSALVEGPITAGGVTYPSLKDALKKLNLSWGTYSTRVYRGQTPEEALVKVYRSRRQLKPVRKQDNALVIKFASMPWRQS